jgi:hypothetical protein
VTSAHDDVMLDMSCLVAWMLAPLHISFGMLLTQLSWHDRAYPVYRIFCVLVRTAQTRFAPKSEKATAHPFFILHSCVAYRLPLDILLALAALEVDSDLIFIGIVISGTETAYRLTLSSLTGARSLRATAEYLKIHVSFCLILRLEQGRDPHLISWYS